MEHLQSSERVEGITINRSTVQKQIVKLETEQSLWQNNPEKVAETNKEINDWRSLFELLNCKELGVENALDFLSTALGVTTRLTQIYTQSDIEILLEDFIHSSSGSKLNTLRHKKGKSGSLGLSPFNIISEKISLPRFTILKVLFSNYSLMTLVLKNYNLLYKNTNFGTNIIDLSDIYKLLEHNFNPNQTQLIWQLYILLNYVRVGIGYISKSTSSDSESDKVLADYIALFNNDFRTTDIDNNSSGKNSILKSINNTNDLINVPYANSTNPVNLENHPTVLNLFEKIYTEVIEQDNDSKNITPKLDLTNLIDAVREQSEHFSQKTSPRSELNKLIQSGRVSDPNTVLETNQRAHINRALVLSQKITNEAKSAASIVSQEYSLDETQIEASLSNTEYNLLKRYDKNDLMNSFCLFLLDLPAVTQGYNILNIQKIITTTTKHLKEKTEYQVLDRMYAETCSFQAFESNISNRNVDNTWSLHKAYLKKIVYPKLSESDLIRFCEQIDFFVDQQINNLFNDNLEPIYRLDLHQRVLKRIFNYLIIPGAVANQPVFSASTIFGANIHNAPLLSEKFNDLIEKTSKTLKNRPLEPNIPLQSSTLWGKMHTTSSDTNTLNNLPSEAKIVALVSKPTFLLSDYYHLLPSGERNRVPVSLPLFGDFPAFHTSEKHTVKGCFKMTVNINQGENTFLIPENSTLVFGEYSNALNDPKINYDDQSQPITVNITSSKPDQITLYFKAVNQKNSVLVKYTESLPIPSHKRFTNWQQWGVLEGSKVEKQLMRLESKVINGDITRLPQIISEVAKIIKSLKIPYDFTEQTYTGDYSTNISKRFVLASQKLENYKRGAICQDFAAFGGIFLAEILKHVDGQVYQKVGYDSTKGVCVNIPHISLVIVSSDGKDVVEFDPTSLALSSKTSRNMEKMCHDTLSKLNHQTTTNNDMVSGLAWVVVIFVLCSGVALSLPQIFKYIDKFYASFPEKNQTLPDDPKIINPKPASIYKQIYTIEDFGYGKRQRTVLETPTQGRLDQIKDKSTLTHALEFKISSSIAIWDSFFRRKENHPESDNQIQIWEKLDLLSPGLKTDLRKIHSDYIQQMNDLKQAIKAKYNSPNAGQFKNSPQREIQMKTELSAMISENRVKLANTLAEYFRTRAKIAPTGNIFTQYVLRDFQQDLNKMITVGSTPKQISILYAGTYDLMVNNYSNKAESGYLNQLTRTGSYVIETALNIPSSSAILVSNISDYQVAIETFSLKNEEDWQSQYTFVDPIPEFVSEKLKQDLFGNYQKPPSMDKNFWIGFLCTLALAGGSFIVLNRKKIPIISQKVIENAINLQTQLENNGKTALAKLKNKMIHNVPNENLKKEERFESLKLLHEKDSRALVFHYSLAGNIMNFLRYSDDKSELPTHLPNLIQQSLTQTMSFKNSELVDPLLYTNPDSITFSNVIRLANHPDMIYLKRWLFERSDLILPFEYNTYTQPYTSLIIDGLNNYLMQPGSRLDVESKAILSNTQEYLKSLQSN
jgi:hypothetical protein